jgi:hypothetical protein
MRGMRLSVFSLLAVSVVLCLLSAPAIYGEHPWDRDYTKPGSLPTTTAVNPGGLTPPTPPQTKIDSTVAGVQGVCPPPVTSPSNPSSVVADWPWSLIARLSHWMAGDTRSVHSRNTQR